MENLINESELVTVSPMVRVDEIREKIKAGDVETVTRFTRGEFKELFNSASQLGRDVHVESVAYPTLDEQEVHQPNVTEEVVDEVEEDPTERSRRIYDLEVKAFEDEKRRLRDEYELSISQEKSQKEKLLKELEMERRRIDSLVSDEDSNGDEDDLFSMLGRTASDVKTSPTVDSVVADLPPEIKERLERVEMIERRLAEKEEWDTTVKSYESFWRTPEGSTMKPEGNHETAMKEFNLFYSELTEGLGNSRDAIRLMYDIKKHGAEGYKDKLNKVGLEVPKSFNSMYDSFEIAQFASGMIVDPTLGKLVPHGRGTYSNLEDAYYILNRDKVRQKDKLEAFQTVQNKLRQKDNSAIVNHPSSYRPVEQEKMKYSDSSYRQALFARARNAGFNGKDINSIRDENVREELAPLFSAMTTK